MGLCVCVLVCHCMFLHIMGVRWWARGCFLGTEGLHCFAFQRRRRGAKGQQQILSSSDVSIADRISSPLQVTTIFFLMLHHTCLSSLPFALSSSHTCACNESCWLQEIYAYRCLIQYKPCWFVFVCLQTLVHPLPLKMKVRGGRIEGQVPGMEKSEGGRAIHLHRHGEGTEMHP